jgi:hypothetical protein
MRKGQGYSYWKQSVEKLKEKWSTFTRGIIRTIAEEEMKISREEFRGSGYKKVDAALVGTTRD